jgi:hypothetical protein
MKYGTYTITEIARARIVFSVTDKGRTGERIDILYDDDYPTEYHAEDEDKPVVLKAPTIEELKSLIDQQEV